MLFLIIVWLVKRLEVFRKGAVLLLNIIQYNLYTTKYYFWANQNSLIWVIFLKFPDFSG